LCESGIVRNKSESDNNFDKCLNGVCHDTSPYFEAGGFILNMRNWLNRKILDFQIGLAYGYMERCKTKSSTQKKIIRRNMIIRRNITDFGNWELKNDIWDALFCLKVFGDVMDYYSWDPRITIGVYVSIVLLLNSTTLCSFRFFL
jgi:hypothetical protein